MQRIARIFYARKTKRWIDVIDSICESYNHTVHRSHGFRPADVNKSNAADVFRRLYHRIITKEPQPPKFSLNQRVRVSAKKLLFSKGNGLLIYKRSQWKLKTFCILGYLQSFGNDIFTVHEIKNSRPVTYVLKDSDGEIIGGSYYNEELQKV